VTPEINNNVHQKTRSKVLVLGIGNTLLTDEGAGIATLNYLEEHHSQHPHVRYLDGGTLSFTLTTELQDTDALIVLDAAELNAQPGTVRCFEAQAMDQFLGQAKRSAHEVGLLDLMDMARLMDRLPKQRALIGIQHETIDWGEAPTAAIARAIPEAAAKAVGLIEKWASNDA